MRLLGVEGEGFPVAGHGALDLAGIPERITKIVMKNRRAGPEFYGRAIGFDTTAVADGTKTSGTYTLVYTGGNMKTTTNGGAHTLAPQASDGTIVVQYTNNASAGSLTTSGYDTVNGDTITTTDGHDFMLYSTVVGSFQHLHVVALQ